MTTMPNTEACAGRECERKEIPAVPELVLRSLIPYPSADFTVRVSSFDGMCVHVAKPLPYRPGADIEVTDFNILEGYAVQSINGVPFNS